MIIYKMLVPQDQKWEMYIKVLSEIKDLEAVGHGDDIKLTQELHMIHQNSRSLVGVTKSLRDINATNKAIEALLSQQMFSKSSLEWIGPISRVIAASARIDSEDNTLDSSDLIDWYMTHDYAFQRSYCMEAHLPPSISLGLISHVLLEQKHATPDLLKDLRDCYIPVQGSMATKTRIFKSFEDKVLWLQVYQACDPSVGSTTAIKKNKESTEEIIPEWLFEGCGG